MVVSREQEGFDRPEAELPIDINYAQLNDWLVDRKKVAGNWRKRLAAIHSQAAALARDLPGSARPHGTQESSPPPVLFRAMLASCFYKCSSTGRLRAAPHCLATLSAAAEYHRF